MATGNLITSIPKVKGRENYDEQAFAVDNFLVLDEAQNNTRTSPVTVGVCGGG